MHKLSVNELPKLKPIDLNTQKVVAIFVSVFLFFILPVAGIEHLNQTSLINSYDQNTTQIAASNTNPVTGRVAGVSDQNTNKILGLYLNDEATLFLIGGIILIGISILLIIFLIVDSRRSKIR